ncbi:MAG: hypothetical protein IT256_08665, partial [Chitinophagaceae bacterium]|nr:hypothetical protein [Chitinophagaceae bacterium]
MFSREKPNNLRRRLRYLAKVKYLNQNSGSYQIDNYDSEWLYVVGNSTIHNSHIRHFIKEDFTEKKNLWFGYEITDILV